MSEKKPLNEGYQPLKKGYQPTPNNGGRGSVTGGYQPEKSHGENPTSRPKPPKSE